MNQQQVTLEEIGERWGQLLSQAFAQLISLQKQYDQLEAEYSRLNEENGDLRERLRQVELNLIAAKGDLVVAQAKEKAAPEDGYSVVAPPD